MQLITNILYARTFLQKGQITIGYKVLNKAEIIAKEYQLFTILNEIHHSKIQYSYMNQFINLDEPITIFRENQQQYLLEEELILLKVKLEKLYKK